MVRRGKTTYLVAAVQHFLGSDYIVAKQWKVAATGRSGSAVSRWPGESMDVTSLQEVGRLRDDSPRSCTG